MAREPEQLLDDAIAMLSEHFIAVRILALEDTPDYEKCHSRGSGSIYIQRGIVNEWLEHEKFRQVQWFMRRSAGPGGFDGP